MESLKYSFKKLWYSLLGKEYHKIGWKITGPNIVILNDNHTFKINCVSDDGD